MIAVTGGTGFIGTHLLERLVSRGERVRAIVRRNASLPEGVEAVRCDLVSDAGLEDAVKGADLVIHLAGVTKALRPTDYYEGNATATRNLARALSGSGARFVHVSSLAAVGPSLDGRPLDEDAAPHPPVSYGKSKLEAERAVRELTPSAVIVRPPVVYGPRDTDVFQLLRSVARGVVAEIAGGDRYFSAIYVKDLVEGILAAAASQRAEGRTYFLSHPKVLSWGELYAVAARIVGRTPRVLRIPLPCAMAFGAAAEAVARLTGKPGIISREKICEARFQSWTCTTARASQELGFTAPTSIETGLAETMAWYKEAGWLTY
jgi:nucleoside-diphosphate-sugar epimerase